MTTVETQTLPTNQVQGHIRKLLDEAKLTDFQKPFLLQRWSEQLNGIAPTLSDIPVPIEQFIEDKAYLNRKGVIYPRVMEALIELNKDGKYNEAVLTGGIGAAKTSVAIYTTLYQLYRLSLYQNPHEQFGLDPTSEIVLIFQSLTERAAKQIDFQRFYELVASAPYFRAKFPHSKDFAAKLVFPKRIEVQPVSSADTAAIGQNVIGGVIDELNYMRVVEKSRNSRQDGGIYDQAVALYNSIARRRASRFSISGGNLPGILCLTSSRRYPNEFTDLKITEAKNNPKIFVYDKRVWDIAPKGRYCGDTFSVFIGDQFRRPRILLPNEKVVSENDQDLVIQVPTEHRGDFERDLLNALREVAGIARLAQHPFLSATESIRKAQGDEYPNLSVEDWTDFCNPPLRLRKLTPSHHFRWAHVDLGVTSDSAGVAVGHVPEFVTIDRGDHIETLPKIRFDLVLEVKPPPNNEILFSKIRAIFYELTNMGYSIRWISYDSWQSRDSLQILRGKGYATGEISVDKTSIPYDVLKAALYDGRIELPPHEKLTLELSSLERDPKTGKIDHPPLGSKDTSDAVAGVAYGLHTRREIYIQHNQPLSIIPRWIQDAADNMQRGPSLVTQAPETE